MPSINIRYYKPSDVKELASIFYHTIHQINSRDYTQEQINAWAPASTLETAGWQKKWEQLVPLVAVCDERVAGFAEFESNGHIDCFYVHHEFQGQGVGFALMKEIHNIAQQNNIQRIFAEVSITAKPFFQRQGFSVIREQIVTIRGVALTNYVMEKLLTK